MESTLAVKLLDPAFHSTWSLWLQAPLFLCLTLLAAVTWLRRARRPLPEGAFLVLAVLFPLAIAVLLPQGEYHFSGHEGAYGELLAGGLPELGDLAGHRTFALPAGVAWALGQVLPEGRAIAVWLAVNRMALGLVLLLLADSCFLLHRRFCSEGDDSGNKSASQIAGGIAIAAACLTPPLVGWSATGFAVVPALALGMLSLRLGLAGRPGFLLAFGACAMATRMETAPLVLAGVLLCPWDCWRRASTGPGLIGLCLGLAMLSLQAFTLSQKTAELPVEELGPNVAVALENAGNLHLGGPLLSLGAAALGVLLVLSGPLRPRFGSGLQRKEGGARAGLALLLALGTALIQPLFLVDLGARHLQPAVLIAVLLVAPSIVAAWRSGSGMDRVRQALCMMFGLTLVLPGIVGMRELDRRYMHGFDALPPSWDAVLVRAPRGSASELFREGCYLVLPRGIQSWEGASDTMDVREVHRAAGQLGEGRCIHWGVDNDFEFSGDTRSERLDRAISTLGLRPVAWIDPSPRGGRPWVLLTASP